jgi:hypothetical protein
VVKKTQSPARQLSLADEDGPPSETIQFYDGLTPALPPATYSINLTHGISGTQDLPDGQSVPLSQSYQIPQAQTFTVEGPEFSLDAGVVQSVYPPDGSSSVFDSVLPFVVLADPMLPWERPITPEDTSDTTPWMALLVLREGEVLLDPTTKSPLTTQTVSDFLASDPNVLKPSISGLDPSVLASTCSVVTITGDAFTALMPLTDDLPFLCHDRQVDVSNEEPALLSVVLANRLALSSTAGTKLYAHLVSLEGYSAYLSSSSASGQSIPQNQAGTGPMNVALVSLASWSFVSQPQEGPTFDGLMQGLISSQNPQGLALPLPADTSSLPSQVVDRLSQGYVALPYATGSGEQTFAWYRGPLSPVVPQPLPAVGNPAVAVASAPSSDALMIYLQDQGLFDLSYASAWQWGRALALADGAFAAQVEQYRQTASAALSLMAQRSNQPHLSGVSPSELLAPNPTRRRFARRLAEGMGKRWNAAFTSSKAPGTPPPRAPKPPRLAETMRGLLKRQDVRDALSAHLGPRLQAVADGVVDLTFLGNVPFSQLVPDQRMLPPESIRFFYVDQGWLDAFTAGALSLAAQTGQDAAVLNAVRPALDAAVKQQRARLIRKRSRVLAAEDSGTPTPLAGVLIRSQLVSGWPELAVSASQGGTALPMARKARLAPDVLLCLFQGVPDQVAVAEPYQGLRFGVGDDGIPLRDVTTAGSIGQQLSGQVVPPSGGFTTFLSTYCRSTDGGVVTVSALATALAQALNNPSQFGAGDFALQMVMAPDLQTFPTN